MEESVQQEPQQDPLPEQPQLDYMYKNEDQGDIRRRLRDRDLLKKRKAEVEEKETDQWDFGTESPRKRGRSGAKRGRRRGRPRKTEPVITDDQNETALGQDTTATVIEAVQDETPSSMEIQLGATASPVAVPVFEQLNPTSQAPANTSEPRVDAPPIPVLDMAPVPDAVPISVPPIIEEPLLVQPIYAEFPNKAALNPILIEDLGPDEEEDLRPPGDKQVGEDLSETPITAEPVFLSNPTMSSPPPQEYVSGNSL